MDNQYDLSPLLPALEEIYAKASTDGQFKERVAKDGTGVLRELGVDVPEGVEISFNVQDAESSRVTFSLPMVLPLRDELLENVSGGASTSGAADDVKGGLSVGKAALNVARVVSSINNPQATVVGNFFGALTRILSTGGC
jgi:hypothetical protein